MYHGRVTDFEPGLEHATRAVGDRWSLLVLAALLDGAQRYGELQTNLPGISSNVLAARLASLERAGLISSEPYSRRPLRVSYALTDAGRELRTAIEALAAWGERRPGLDEDAQPQHALCGSPLELRWYCPACDETLASASEGEDPFADPRALIV